MCAQVSRRCPVHSLTALRAHLTQTYLTLTPCPPSTGSPEMMALPWERNPRPDPTPPSPRPPSGRWPCPPSAGNQSILAADMLAGCPLRSMRGGDGLGLRSTGQQASSRFKPGRKHGRWWRGRSYNQLPLLTDY